MVAKISVAVWQDTILYDSFVVTSKVQVNEFIFLMRIILMSNNSNTSSYINTDQDIFEKFKERAMSDLDGAWNSVLV
jgi:hypothetical protein